MAILIVSVSMSDAFELEKVSRFVAIFALHWAIRSQCFQIAASACLLQVLDDALTAQKCGT